jgi:hypothetical protein
MQKYAVYWPEAPPKKKQQKNKNKKATTHKTKIEYANATTDSKRYL